jgi:hypothetical protein
MKTIIKVFKPSLNILLTSHIFGFTIRKVAFKEMTDYSELFKFYEHSQNFNFNTLDVFYGVILIMTLIFSFKDISYNKSFKTLKKTEMNKIIKDIEIVILTITIWLFQNIENVT